MSNGSPGRHSNKAFSIGSDDGENENVFVEETSTPPKTPLGTLLTNCTEQSPLILPMPTRPRLEDSPVAEHDHHIVVDVFTVNNDDGTWKQASRFARYEEDCEGFDNHLGRPHVPCIPMGTYDALKMVTAKSILFPKVQYESLDEFVNFLETKIVDPDVPKLGEKIAKLINDRIAEIEKMRPLHQRNSSSTQSLDASNPQTISTVGIFPRSLLSAPNNLGSLAHHPMRRLPTSHSGLRFGSSFLPQQPVVSQLEPVIWDEDNEISMLVAGEIPHVNVCRFIAIRFVETTAMEKIFPNMTNVRHLFFLIGPALENVTYLDLGRALASVVSNPPATTTFDQLKSPDSITKAIERFLAGTVVIAPGRIDNKNLVRSDLIRKLVNMQGEKTETKIVHPKDVDVERNATKKAEEAEDKPFRLFSGVTSDLRNRAKHYFSDYRDGFNISIFTVVFYMFCVTVVPTLTFGAIMGAGTSGLLAVKECLVSQALSGLIWSVLSCQPLLVMSPTGPFLVFEKALFKFTDQNDMDFLEVRFYTGIFLFFISIVGAATNCAHLIHYVTIYTEDIFCALISLIFFSEVVEFIHLQEEHNSIENLKYYIENAANCTVTEVKDCALSRPNTFLLQLIMVVVSIAIFHYLRQVSRSTFFGRTFRNLCKNFGGIFAVIAVSIAYRILFQNVGVAVVDIPVAVGQSRPFDGIFVIPSAPPTASTLTIALISSILLFVLIFVETEIPEQMALREGRKLKKGGGLHWDLIVVGFCTLVSSVLGLPWMCPAAVQSLAHITSLTEYKKSAPGVPSRISHVIEQRVSGMVTYLLLGTFAILGHFLAIPAATIFGVFFYLGVRNLEGSKMILRLKLCFLPSKYRGSHKFLEILVAFSSHSLLYPTPYL
ncbi:Anion exchange protein [Caenorhabditis elegans]|uniref:Anion exchange protein n=1 Tax=Caenorhabditis elegans TaxID=6239 RepID=Q45EK3_CAEEL|nr:Anion exchange protein [Caenorhabditis elegans]CCD72423.1 Anion exchange protein [Caenorhabditis elegans]|eukprot:NP_001024827.2 Anion/Bicarbonate TranSporter family [Caenorhabditis elegans]